MNKSKKIIIVCIIILLIAIIGVTVYALINKNTETQITDAIKFKEEYIKLNGTVNENNQKNYPEVEIDDLNVFKYISEEEVIKILEGGSGIIYFGFPTCPWCRNSVNFLQKSAVNTGIDQINYIDILDMRSTISLDENNKPITTKEGSENYKKILKLMDDVLDDFELTTSNGKKVKTGEKRLYAPTVITVENGKIQDINVGTVESHTDGYKEMSKEEQEELFKIYTDMFKKYNDSSCEEAC